jgi:hypothetical protein
VADVLITALSCRLPKALLPVKLICVDEVDPAATAVDDLRHDIDLGAPDAPVRLDDTSDIGLHHSALQRAARLGLDSRCKVGVLDLPVAFECDAVEYRRLRQMHHKLLAGALDGNFLEQARCD